MRFINSQKEAVYRKLLRLAGGEPVLVEAALRKFGSGDKTATLSEVVAYIEKHRKSHPEFPRRHAAG